MDALSMLRLDTQRAQDDDELEETVWLAVCDAVEAADEPPSGVLGDWFWTRLCLWDSVDNGMAEAMVEHHEHLPRMTAAWRRLGRDDMARLYEEAAARLPAAGQPVPDDAFDDLDEQLDDAMETLQGFHLGLLRAHRQVFIAALSDRRAAR